MEPYSQTIKRKDGFIAPDFQFSVCKEIVNE
jgi:hypothetical protein